MREYVNKSEILGKQSAIVTMFAYNNAFILLEMPINAIAAHHNQVRAFLRQDENTAYMSHSRLNAISKNHKLESFHVGCLI